MMPRALLQCLRAWQSVGAIKNVSTLRRVLRWALMLTWLRERPGPWLTHTPRRRVMTDQRLEVQLVAGQLEPLDVRPRLSLDGSISTLPRQASQGQALASAVPQSIQEAATDV